MTMFTGTTLDGIIEATNLVEQAAEALYSQDCTVSGIYKEEKVHWLDLSAKEKQIYRDDALICWKIFKPRADNNERKAQ